MLKYQAIALVNNDSENESQNYFIITFGPPL